MEKLQLSEHNVGVKELTMAHSKQKVGRQRWELQGNEREHRVWRARRLPAADEDVLQMLMELATNTNNTEPVQEMTSILRNTLPWDVLGVPRDATVAECNAAYRRKSLLLHPDKFQHPLGLEAFKRLGEAYGWSKERTQWEERQRAAKLLAYNAWRYEKKERKEWHWRGRKELGDI